MVQSEGSWKHGLFVFRVNYIHYYERVKVDLWWIDTK